MRAIERERKLAQCCQDCGTPLAAGDTTNLCERHRLKLNARVARWKAKQRQQRAAARRLPTLQAAAA